MRAPRRLQRRVGPHLVPHQRQEGVEHGHNGALQVRRKKKWKDYIDISGKTDSDILRTVCRPLSRTENGTNNFLDDSVRFPNMLTPLYKNNSLSLPCFPSVQYNQSSYSSIVHLRQFSRANHLGFLSAFLSLLTFVFGRIRARNRRRNCARAERGAAPSVRLQAPPTPNDLWRYPQGRLRSR